jgi:hypothetical protein
LNALQEVWDLLEPEAGDTYNNHQLDTMSEQCFLTLSEAAVSGLPGPRTLKIRGTIQDLEILILIDSWSSHSFISSQVAALLQGVSMATSPVQVKDANGAVLDSSAELLQTILCMQGYTFTSDLKVLVLHNFYMVIGMDWLEKHSPMKAH